MSDFLAKVIAQLDTSQADTAMTNFLKDRNLKVKVDLDTGNINFDNLINQIKSQFQSVGQTAGQSMATTINGSLEKIKLKNTASEIADLKKTLGTMNFSTASIDKITQNLQELDLTVARIRTEMSGKKLRVTVDGIDEMKHAVNIVQEFDSATGKVQQSSKTITQSFQRMFSDFDVSKLSTSISTLDANFIKLHGATNDWSTQLQKLKQDLSGLDNIGDLGKRQAEFERITQEVKELSVAYKQAKAESVSAAEAQKVLTGKNILGNQITAWMNNNTKATKAYETELHSLQTQLDAVTNSSQLKNVANQFREIKSTAAAEGNLGKSVFGQLIGNMTKLSPLFGMGSAISSSMNAVKSMVGSVYELDTALVDLQKTTTMNSTDLEAFYNNSNNIAKQMGVSTAEIINQASAWSRLGYSSKEAAESMAQLSSQFAAISPGMDVDKATDGLVSIMKANICLVA